MSALTEKKIFSNHGHKPFKQLRMTPSPSQGEGSDGGSEIEPMHAVDQPHYPHPNPPPERGREPSVVIFEPAHPSLNCRIAAFTMPSALPLAANSRRRKCASLPACAAAYRWSNAFTLPSASACGSIRRSVVSRSSRIDRLSCVFGCTTVPSRPKRQAWKRL